MPRASGQPNDKAAPRETSFNEASSIPDLLSSSPSGHTAVPLPDVIPIHPSGYTALLTAGVLLAVAVGLCLRYKTRAKSMAPFIPSKRIIRRNTPLVLAAIFALWFWSTQCDSR